MDLKIQNVKHHQHQLILLMPTTMITMMNKALEDQGEGQIATVLTTTATTERKVMRNLSVSWTRKNMRNEIKNSIINELTMKTNVHSARRHVAHHPTTITATITITAAHITIINNDIAVAVVGVILTDTPEVEVHPRAAMTLIVKS